MPPILIYLFPALGDVIVSSCLFAGTVRVAELGLSAKAVAGVIALWAAVYMLTNQIVGGRLTPKNAGTMLVGSSLGAAAVSLGFLLLHGLAALYILTAFLAVVIAFFFTPFQVFMKEVDQSRQKTVAYSTGTYVFAWSTGFALGPFIAGYLWQWGVDAHDWIFLHLGLDLAGWEGIYVVNVAIGIAAALVIHTIHCRTREAAPAAEAVTDPLALEPLNYGQIPNRAWMAWTCAGAGVIAAAFIRAIFPKHGLVCHLPKADLGLVLFALSMTQGIVGLLLRRGRTWMFRPVPLALFGLAGILGLGLFAAAHTRGAFVLAAVLFGVYAGSFYFYFVFHPLIHPTRGPRYMAINESIVGLAGLLALGGGAIADGFGFATTYWIGAVLVLMAIGAQCVVHRHDARMLAVQQDEANIEC